MYVYIPEQSETIPQSCMDYLSNSLTTAITTDGLAAQSEYLTPFLLVPKVNIATKNTLATTQQQVVLTLDVNLQVVDNTSGTVFASTIINLKGVGTNEIKAYNAAFRSINKSNAKIREFVSNAKAKIIAYYEKEGDYIIRKALHLAEQHKYEEAFYLLSTMPSQYSQYDHAVSASMEVWGRLSRHLGFPKTGKGTRCMGSQSEYGRGKHGRRMSFRDPSRLQLLWCRANIVQGHKGEIG